MGCRDLISSLPDEILCKILSYLCTYGAVSTSVLSTRWRNLHLLVDRLDLSDARGDPRYFCDFVNRTLHLLRNSNSLKSFSLTCASTHVDDSRVNKWIDTVLKGGFLELDLHIEDGHCIDTGFFTSDTLLHLSLCEFYLEGSLPPGGVFFPKLKTLSLVQVDFSSSEMYDGFISGCPVLEDFCLHNCDDNINPPTWNGVVVSPSIKRLTIFQHWPHNRDAHEGCCWFDTPSLVYLDYSSYVCQEYEVNLASLIEARLDIQSWERRRDEDESDEENYENGEAEHIFGDVTDLVAGISTVKTLYLSANSLEVLLPEPLGLLIHLSSCLNQRSHLRLLLRTHQVFHLCCKSMPVFHNLLTLSFESDKEIGWQVVPLLLNNSPNLETLVMKGLVHQVTDKCGDSCACIRKGACCLSTCQVKVLNISGYHGTSRELKQMRHFLGNLKCLETVKVDIEVNRDKDANNTYLRITDALMKLPRVSSNCHIHFS